MAVGSTTAASVSATDASGNVVLLAVGANAETVAWTTSATGTATVAGTGPTATVVGVAAGTTTLKVKDDGTTVSGSGSVTVTGGGTTGGGTTGGNGGGLANSAWPKFRGDLQNTGRGAGAVGAGLILRSFPLGSGGTSPTLGSGTDIFTEDNRSIYSFNKFTGQQNWTFETGNPVTSSPAVGANGIIYATSLDGKVYALRQDSGGLLWSYQTRASISSSPTIGYDGTVYVGSDDNNYYAFNGSTGEKLWSFNPGAEYESLSSAAIDSQDNLYFGSYDHDIYSVDGRTGTRRWSFTAASVVLYAPALGSNTVFVASRNFMYALDASNGNLKWTYDTGDTADSIDVNYGSVGLSTDGLLFFGTYHGEVICLSQRDGTLRWKVNASGQGLPITTSPVLGSDGTLYVAYSDINSGPTGSHMRALRSSDGLEIWNPKLSGTL